MKLRPFVLWLILGVAALAVWLAWPSGNGPARQPATALATPKPSVDSSLAPMVTGGLAPTPLPSANAVAAGGSQPSGVPPATIGPAPFSANGSPVPALNPGGPGALSQAAQSDVVRVRHMIADYHTLMGENPVGTNAEIMKQMTGGNARQATLGPPDGTSLNAQGELIDPWGTPYFFHQLNRDKMEIRSAGPDKVMWTADDVVAR